MSSAKMIDCFLQDQETPGLPPVAYLVSRFPKLTETFILREILELRRRGRPVLVYPLLCVQQKVRHLETRDLADKVAYTPYISCEVIAANLHFLTHTPCRYLATLFSIFWDNRSSFHIWLRDLVLFPKSVCIARRIVASGTQHIHAHFATHPALTALIISNLTGIGFSFTAHAHDIFVHTSMLRQKIDSARFVVSISEFNKQFLLRLCPGIEPEKIHIVRCGVEPERYANPQCRSRTGEVLQILCVASLEPYKGIEYLIRACDRLRNSFPKFRCQVIGEGREHAKLAALIDRLQLDKEVCLTGARKQDEIAEQLRRADLFVLPSVIAANGQMEGIPVALMEAMASGVPVIASRISGIPELIDHGVNGLLVSSADVAALADAMTVLCLRQDLREQFGMRGREKISAAFQLSDNVAKLNDLFGSGSSVAAQPTPEPHFPLHSQTVRQVLREQLGFDDDQRPYSIEDLHPTTGGHDSFVYAVRTNGHRPGLIVKRHRPRENPGRAVGCARREHRILTYLSRELGRDSRNRVPEPLALFPEEATLVMRECPGENFGKRLRWAPLPQSSRLSAWIIEGATACGEWLDAFQRATRRNGPWDLQVLRRIESSFRRDLKTCEKLGLSGRTATRASAYFHREFESARSGEVVTGHHGDFGPHNVFLSPDCTTVIDFEGFRLGLPYEDLADFLILTDLLPFYHASPALRGSIREAFLKGYGRQRPLDKERLRFFELQALVKRMAHNPQLGPSFNVKFYLKRKRLLRSYRRHFSLLLS